jgi:enterobactin synthetase component D
LADFIHKHSTASWWPIDEGKIIFCHFNLADFRPECFEEYEIPFSNSVQRAVAKRQAEYLAGRFCAHRALEAMGIYVKEVATGAHRQPLWPDGWCGSISHNKDMAVACVTKSPAIYGIGIDLESLVETRTMCQIQDSVLTAEEKAIITDKGYAVDLSRELLFSTIFSLKESFFKAAFNSVGRYFDFDSVTVTAIDSLHPQSGELRFYLNETLCEDLQKHTEFSGHFRFIQDSVSGSNSPKILTLVTLRK